MKRLLQNIIKLILLLSPMCAAASSPIYTLEVSKVMLPESPDEIKSTPIKHRMPSAPIVCIITMEGISVQDSAINLAEAISYEIWDVCSESCLASFCDEVSFAESIYSMTGELQIRIIFTEYELRGNIDL